MATALIFIIIIILIALGVGYLTKEKILEEKVGPEKITPPQPPQKIYQHSVSEKVVSKSESPLQTISTINMYVESHYQLNLSMFGRKSPTLEMINEAYEKLLNEHVNSIAKGKAPSFNISEKQKAKAYLIEYYSKNK
ncbi:MAG: hypothetical protein EB100_09005 [Crocinitomicaceae bacterium]|jgi:hypothetical protein|nr:hypothetical protein [Crocinitomicaceae bacterium]